jgi:hypothetical protein
LWLLSNASQQGNLLAYVELIAVMSITISNPFKQSSLKMPTLEQDQLIAAVAESDPDALLLSYQQMNAMVHARAARSSKAGRDIAAGVNPIEF